MEVSKEIQESIRDSIRSIGPTLTNGISLLAEKTYPEITEFKVEIFPNEGKHRGRPHCKVTTDKGAVTIDLHTIEIIVGSAGHWEGTIQKVLGQECHKNALLNLWNNTRPNDQRL